MKNTDGRKGRVIAVMFSALPLWGQVDQERAAAYFKEAAALCQREGGRLWGVSLCGPMVFADAATGTMAVNQPAPDGPRPRFLGYANATADWGGQRWATFVWQFLLVDQGRGQLKLHELFHRVQEHLGLMTRDGQNDHLDTLGGRYWMQLEWRALAKALGAAGAERTAAVRDALAFRLTRRSLFPGAAENERLEEIREGLAQYTATVAAAPSPAEAAADAIVQLGEYPKRVSFVREFAYPSGAGYGILLDAWSPGWRRQMKSTDDLGQRLMAAAGIAAAGLNSRDSSEQAAKRYGAADLRIAEEKRDAKQKAKVAELQRRFVEGPVLVLPNAGGSFNSTGITSIPGAGTVFPAVRVTAEWGTLEAANAFRPTDRSNITVPAPASVEGSALSGDGWTLQVAPGWVVRPGSRAGDFRLVREVPRQ